MIASDALFARIADVLKAMGDTTRLKVLHVLASGEHCVSEVLAVVGGSQANISKHLAVLKRAGLVSCRREGLNRYYRIADERVFSICRSVCDSIEVRSDLEHRAIVEGRIEVEMAQTAKDRRN